MNKEQDNKHSLVGLVIFLFILVLALSAYIVYNKMVERRNGETVKDINVVDNGIDEKELNSLFDIIGISHSGKDVKDCLNYYVSSNNYQSSENIYQIFSWIGEKYAIPMYEPCLLLENGDCAPNGDAVLVTKHDVEERFKLYGINKSIDDYSDIFKLYADGYLKVSYDRIKNYDENQKYYTFVPAHHVGNCDYDVMHDATIQKNENNEITITDNQIVTEYEWDKTHFDSIKKVEKNAKNQKVTYNFKKNDEGNYNLANVTVE